MRGRLVKHWVWELRALILARLISVRLILCRCRVRILFGVRGRLALRLLRGTVARLASCRLWL